MSATLIPACLQRRLTRSSSCCSCYFRSSGSTTTHPKTLLSMKPWLDSAVVLVHQGVQCGYSKNGYLLDTLVYTGADTLEEASPEFESLPQPGQVVMHLMRHYLDSNHHVYTDRYYTSIPLTQSLASNNTSFTGTVMKNRTDLPDTIRAKSFSLKQGDNLSFRCEQLLVTAWRAKGKDKTLIMLSSSSSAVQQGWLKCQQCTTLSKCSSQRVLMTTTTA